MASAKQPRAQFVSEVISCQALLRAEFELRKAKNPRYSARAFAKFLGLNPAFLRSLLLGEKTLSTARCEVVAARLKLSDREHQALLRGTRAGLDTTHESARAIVIQADKIRGVLPWQIHAILARFGGTEEIITPAEVNQLIGIGPKRSLKFLTILVSHGVLRSLGGDRFAVDANGRNWIIRTSGDRKVGLRARADLSRAANQARKDPYGTKSLFGSCYFRMDPAFLPEFRERLFNRIGELCGEYESKSVSNSVWTVSFQAYDVLTRN